MNNIEIHKIKHIHIFDYLAPLTTKELVDKKQNIEQSNALNKKIEEFKKQHNNK